MNEIYESIGRLKEALQKLENAFIVEKGKVRGIPILGHVIHFDSGTVQLPTIYLCIPENGEIRVKKILPGSNYATAVMSILETGFTCDLPGWILLAHTSLLRDI